VAALAAWHVAHDVARRAASDAAIPAHARLETYSVLTRLPAPHRLPGAVVAELLERWFPAEETLMPSAGLTHAAVARCSRAAVLGGAVYDALVAFTAAESNLVLLTRDERAAGTYERLGIAFRLVR
jgi:predicted nucleic acid-binding protein